MSMMFLPTNTLQAQCPDNKVTGISYSPNLFQDPCTDVTISISLSVCVEDADELFDLEVRIPKSAFSLQNEGIFDVDATDPDWLILSQEVIPLVVPKEYAIVVRMKSPGFDNLNSGSSIRARAKWSGASSYSNTNYQNVAVVFKEIDGTGSPAYLSDEVDPTGPLGTPAYSCTGSQNILIKGDLIVDIDYCFTSIVDYDCKIFLEEGARIMIDEGSELRLRGAKLRGCAAMWDGIFVEDGKLTTELSQSGSKRALISDAFKGISLKNGTSAELAVLDVADCRYGIYSPSIGSGNSLKNIYLNFDDVHIYGTGTLKPMTGMPGSSGFAWDYPISAIELNDVYAFVNTCEEAPSVWGGTCGTRIDNTYRGIVLNNTSADLKGFGISDLREASGDVPGLISNTAVVATAPYVSNLHYTGFGKTGYPVFKNVAKGFYLKNVDALIEDVLAQEVNDMGVLVERNLLKSVLIKNSRIYSHQYGVVAWNNNSSNFGLETSDLRHADLLTSSTIGNQPSYGVLLANNAGDVGKNRIEDNLIEMPTAQAGILSQSNYINSTFAENTIYGGDYEREYGIRVSGGNPHMIDCNLLSADGAEDTDPSAAIYMQLLSNSAVRCNATYDFPRGIEYFGPSIKTRAQANSINDHHIGLFYDHEAVSTKHFFSGNCWSVNFLDTGGPIGAKNTHEDEKMVVASQHIFDDSPITCFNTEVQVYDPSFAWFTNSEGDNLECGDEEVVTCTGGPGADHPFPLWVPDSLDWRIAVDSFVSVLYGYAPLWQAQRYLYRVLTENPTYVTSGSVWEDFLNAVDSTSVAQYEVLAEGLRHAATPDTTKEQLVLNLRAGIDSLTNLVVSYRQVADTLGTGTIKDSLNNLANNELVILGELADSLAGIHYEVDSLFRWRLNQLNTLNSAASNDSLWESCLQYVNARFIQVLLNGQHDLDSLQMDSLAAIANRCPMVYGDGVFLARGIILALAPESSWDDNALCVVAEESYSRKGEPLSFNITVQPNPGVGQFQVHLAGHFSSLWSMRLYDLQGNVMDSWTFPSGIVQLDLTNYKSGMYILQAVDQKGEVHLGKVVIAH
ncbi:MAG: T9SS type A sorting domain-containing protein [Saprospiraceae bacterium]